MAGLAWCRSWLWGKAPPGERHSSPQNTSFALQSGGVFLPPPHFLLKQSPGGLLPGPQNPCCSTSCSTEACPPPPQQHPCGQSELFITGVRHPPSGLCVGHADAHMHIFVHYGPRSHFEKGV